MSQILSALLVIVLGVAGMVLYFYGSNRILDTVLADKITPDGAILQSRDKIRETIRPWLFIGPAVLLLGLYLIYPAIQTFILSFFDESSRNFVGLRNYEWAAGNGRFQVALRNNILWLAIVPAACTILGLLIAVLADRVRWESVAKSLIFMPMAISFVGASIIWDFMYYYRSGEIQIGLLNAIVVALGGQPQGWVTLQPWNNFFLMVILIWIQTGFAMVLISSALKGVPDETIEAARIDGASEVQIFFRIIIPQITSTLLVVMTTLIILVLKVFDIVLTMTDGQWNTEVLANYMDRLMFRGATDYGRGSMVAVVIMLATLPIMIWNIRRFSREEKLR